MPPQKPTTPLAPVDDQRGGRLAHRYRHLDRELRGVGDRQGVVENTMIPPVERPFELADKRSQALMPAQGQGCVTSKPPTNRDTERPAQSRHRAEPKQEPGRLTGRPSSSSDYSIECARECARQCSAPG